MIAFKKVSKRFGNHEVLKSFDLELANGETVALLGLSGSGKTTALKLVCGIHTPNSGSIWVNDLELVETSLKKIRGLLGYVIQDGGLFPHLTAFQNLSLVGTAAGWSSEDIQSRIVELADLAKISKTVLKSYPREISGGQRQRIGIMRALFLNPPILLLDEPFGALDPITRRSLQEDLRDLCRKMDKTVLMVTHDLYEAGYMASRVVLLNHGQIAQVGTIGELLKDPADGFVREFVNSQRHIETAN